MTAALVTAAWYEWVPGDMVVLPFLSLIAQAAFPLSGCLMLLMSLGLCHRLKKIKVFFHFCTIKPQILLLEVQLENKVFTMVYNSLCQ